jgi:hypothetical protein
MLNKGNSFTNLLIEARKVLNICLNLYTREINKHASNLRGISFSDKFFHVAIDEFSYHLLKIGIFRRDGG